MGANFEGPLSGIKVVEISTMLAAPIATKALADWGADVIHVEDMDGRDAMRTFGSVLGAPVTEDENPVLDDAWGGKRNIGLDLKTPEGMDVLHKMLSQADVLVTNFRLEALERLHLSYDDLKAKYPSLIYGHLLAYGDKGPDKDLPGYDQCAFLARSGLLTELVEPGESPVNTCLGLGDRITGMNLAGGICAALVRKLRTGKGELVKVSLLHSAVYSLTNVLLGIQYGNLSYPRTRKKPTVANINTYQTKDGRWLVLAETRTLQNFNKWCQALGLEHLANNEKYQTAADIIEDTVFLTQQFEEAILGKNLDEWMDIFAQADLVCEKCQTFEELIEDPQVEANQYLVPVNYPSRELKVGTMPVQFEETGLQEHRKGARLGENTDQIMEYLGYSSAQIEELRKMKAIK